MALRKDEAQGLNPPHFQPLPSLREVQSLIDLLRNEEVDFELLSAEFAGCPGIEPLMLQAANAVGVGMVREINSLRHAVAILGLNRVRAILFAVQDDVLRARRAAPPVHNR